MITPINLKDYLGDCGIRLFCKDCGKLVSETGKIKPKELAKKNNWKHVGKGAWVCPECYQDRIRKGKRGDLNDPIGF
jgi:hypothetical protein